MSAFHSRYSVGRARRTVTPAMRNPFGASECEIRFCKCFGTSMESAHSTEEKGKPAENAGRPGAAAAAANQVSCQAKTDNFENGKFLRYFDKFVYSPAKVR